MEKDSKADLKFKGILALMRLIVNTIAEFKRTPDCKSGGEWNSDMSSSLEKTPPFQGGEDVIRLFFCARYVKHILIPNMRTVSERWVFAFEVIKKEVTILNFR